MTLPQVPPEEYFKGPPLPLRDFGLTNLGDFTVGLPGEGEHLQQTNIIMFASIHLTINMMLHQIYTYRGHSPYTLSYDTSYVNEQTATAMADSVMALLDAMCRSRSQL